MQEKEPVTPGILREYLRELSDKHIPSSSSNITAEGKYNGGGNVPLIL